MANTKKLIWLVGGGTGGHVLPLFPVAEELKKDDHIKLMYIGGGGRTLEAKLAREANIPYRSIPFGKLRRYFTISSIILNCIDTIKIIAGVVASCRLIKREHPSIIFSKGGPVSLPVAMAARIMKVPLMTHESDVTIGATNRFIASFATKVFTSFPAHYYPIQFAAKIVPVGLPIRRQFCLRQGEASKKPTLLVMGGSQGSLAINELIRPIIIPLLDSCNVIHITGEATYPEFRLLQNQLGEAGHNYEAISFTGDIATYVHKATVVISRASSAIFEIASAGKPMLLIPLPGSAQDHQVKNAQVFVEHHAAVMLRQERLTSEILYERIENILQDKDLQKQLQEGSKTFQSCDAAKKVASVLKESL